MVYKDVAKMCNEDGMSHDKVTWWDLSAPLKFLVVMCWFIVLWLLYGFYYVFVAIFWGV